MATDSILGFDGTFETNDFVAGKTDGGISAQVATNPNSDATGMALKLTATSNTNYKYGLIGKYITLDKTKDYIVSFDVWRDSTDANTADKYEMILGIGGVGITTGTTTSTNDIGYGANILKLTASLTAKGQKQTVSGIVTSEQLQQSTDNTYWWSVQFNKVNDATIWVDNISITEYIPDSVLGFDGTFETFEIGNFTDSKGDTAVTKVIAENTNPDASGKALKLTATSNTSYKWGLVGKYIALDDTKDYVISFDVWRDQNDTTPENCTMQFGIGAHSSNDIGYGANILTLTVNTFGTANAGVKQTVSGVVTAEQLQAATVGDKGYWWSIQFRNVNNATIWVDNISIKEYVADSILGFDGSFETLELGQFTDGKGDTAVTKVIAENTNPDASGKALKLTATSNTSYKWGLVGKYIALDDTKDYVISFDVWRDQNDTTPENCTMQFGIGAHSSNDIGNGANILTLEKNTFGTANAGVKQTVSGVVTAEQLQAATVGDKGYWWSIQFRGVNNATIWVDNIIIAPTDLSLTFAGNQIRENAPVGLRFATLIDAKLFNAVNEVGFLVTGEDLLPNGMTAETFTAESAATAGFTKYLQGKAKDSTGTEIVYDKTGTVFENSTGKYAITAVITGITSATQDKNFIVKPYIYDNGHTYYGAAQTAKYSDVLAKTQG